jgi:GNAT superfamily N-acetyltransferase
MSIFIKTEKPNKRLREEYLSSLPFSQELFLEQLVRSGETWSFHDHCYAVVNGQAVVEFYCTEETKDRQEEFFASVLQVSGATTVLAKSFDQNLVFPALAIAAKVTSSGLLFRSYSPVSVSTPGRANLRIANGSDVKNIVGINDDFFDGEAEVRSYVKAGGLFVLEGTDGVVGCGITTEIVSGYRAVDLGMLVAVSMRSRGYGSFIVSQLAGRVIANGRIPVCGCSADNLASAGALRKAGFDSKHRILNIELLAE